MVIRDSQMQLSGFFQSILFFASQNLILAGQKNFGQADGIGIKKIHTRKSFHIYSH